jgi:hypothetical protein
MHTNSSADVLFLALLPLYVFIMNSRMMNDDDAIISHSVQLSFYKNT